MIRRWIAVASLLACLGGLAPWLLGSAPIGAAHTATTVAVTGPSPDTPGPTFPPGS